MVSSFEEAETKTKDPLQVSGKEWILGADLRAVLPHKLQEAPEDRAQR